ncbi:MAG: hypothetical protein LBD97_01515 [Bifidobacteriaceae bacterium]|jgi:hypothetical protein|nr:hypothetical protein [Bifidobacteriaceae bacterium]
MKHHVRVAAAAATAIIATTSVTGCGAIDAALSEGSRAAAAVYSKDLYLEHADPVHVGFSPDPSGSLSLTKGDMLFAEWIQQELADAIANRLPPAPPDYAAGAAGIPEIHLLYLPVGDASGEWRGDKSSVSVVLPGVPRLLPEPQPATEDDVPGPNGKGAAWLEAKAAYLAAHDAAAQGAATAAQTIAKFPLEGQGSDIFGSIMRLAERLPAGATILCLGDLQDTEDSAATRDLAGYEVIAVQACVGDSTEECADAATNFTDFVESAGGTAPLISGHEAARQIIDSIIGPTVEGA